MTVVGVSSAASIPASSVMSPDLDCSLRTFRCCRRSARVKAPGCSWKRALPPGQGNAPGVREVEDLVSGTAMSLSRALVRVPPLVVCAEVPCLVAASMRLGTSLTPGARLEDAGLGAVEPGDATGDDAEGAVGSGSLMRTGGAQGARGEVGSGCSRAVGGRAGEGSSSSLLLSSMGIVASVDAGVSNSTGFTS